MLPPQVASKMQQSLVLLTVFCGLQASPLLPRSSRSVTGLPRRMERSACSNSDTQCILRQMWEAGAITDLQFQRNLFFLTRKEPSEGGIQSRSDESYEHTSSRTETQRHRHNSKYNPDCWTSNGAFPNPGVSAIDSASTTEYYTSTIGDSSANPESDLPRSLGRGATVAPCLWETGYYLGDQ